MTVAIIGAGITGLALARQLAGAGVDCEIFEAASTPGGLLRPLQLAGQAIDGFYHHFFRGDRHTLALCAALGLGVEWRAARTGHEINGRVYPLGGVRDWLALPGVPTTAALGLARLALDSLAFSTRPRFDGQSALDYLRRTQHPTLRTGVFEPLLRRRFGDDADRVSAFWLLDRLGSRLRGNLGRNERLGFPTGGFRSLAARLHETVVDAGVPIHLAAPVQTVERDGDDVVATTAAGARRFAAAVSTVPFPVLRELLPPGARDGLPTVPHQPCRCLALAATGRLSPFYWLNVTSDLGVTGVIEHANFIPADGDQPRVVYVSHYGVDIGTAALLERARTMIATLFPDFAGEILDHAAAFAPQAQPVFATGWLARRPGRVEPLPRVLATDASLDLPYQTRSVDGALRRAAAAARWVEETV